MPVNGKGHGKVLGGRQAVGRVQVRRSALPADTACSREGEIAQRRERPLITWLTTEGEADCVPALNIWLGTFF